MGKSDRHKKLRRQEKTKTQLKGVKKLGPPQNIIEPTFRAKKILIREQLQNPGEGEVVQISRNRSLQDVLHSLTHHNTNIKKDAIQGLDEIISSHPEALYANLDKILEKIGSLTSDIEGSIRKENLELSEKIFALLSEDQIKPFWNLLLTYIKCTLTNLNPAVRHGCLPFISLLLSYFPSLVPSSLQSLLPSVLGLISSVGRTADNSSNGVKVQTRLKLEISKQDNSKERVKVLQFLASCLDLHNSERQEPSGSESKATKNPSLVFSDKNPICHVGLYYPFGYQECHGESYYYGSQGSSNVGASLGCRYNLGNGGSMNYLHDMITPMSNLNGSSGGDMNATNFWPHFVESCLPLLNQTWLEVRPEMKDGNIDNRVGKEEQIGKLCNLSTMAVDILECIVSVMTRLIMSGNISKSESWSTTVGTNSESNILRQLRKNQGQDLKKYFFQWIPFSAIQDSQRKALTLMNLQLFYIAAQLRLIDAQIMQSFDNYLHVLMKKSALDSMQISTVLEILPLIRISTVDMLTSKVLIYAVSSGYFESVHEFLLRILELGQGTKKDGGRDVMLHSINWESIVKIILREIPSFTSSLLNILTRIALRRLLDLKPILNQQSNHIQTYLTKWMTNLEAWDEVVCLLHYADCLEILLDSNYFNLNPPSEIQETVIGLRTFHTPVTSDVNSMTEPFMDVEVE